MSVRSQMLRTVFNWTTIFKSAFVAFVIGTALTFVNYGDVITDSERLPCWWRVVLNFVIPFFAEVLLCVFLSYFLTTEQEELLLQTAKHTTLFCNALPEIAVHSKPVYHSKSIDFSPQKLKTCSEDYPQTQRQDSCPVLASLQAPVFSPTASSGDDGCVKTHRNGVSIYTVHSLLDGDDLVSFPSPSKAGVKSQFNKCKSMSCLSDLASSSSRQARTLQVFDNDLFFRD